MTEDLNQFLGPDLSVLLSDGEKLLASMSSGFTDYGFLVFPFAKVYEGFLKKLFFKIGAIDEHQYLSDHWRVGKALNPELEKEIRHTESVYDRIENYYGSTLIPDLLWEAWKKGRNQIFHYFPEHYHPLSSGEAKSIISEINQAMEKALQSSKM